MSDGRFIIWLLVLTLCAGAGAARAQTPPAKAPRVFSRSAALLKERKMKLADAKTAAAFKSALDALEAAAGRALKTEIGSVVSKTAVPPSGDKHDYMSQAPYFWKNPNTADGFPYVRRDGERNPEIEKYPDHQLLDRMIETVDALATAYYFTGKEIYADRAAAVLRLWFLDPATKMNPHLDFAQAVPGVNTGRGIGIIETRNLTRVVDAVGLLENSKAWTKSDQTGLEAWFAKYLDWLTTSKNGRDEAAAKNNHGTFYDVQVASFALFVGKKELAARVLEAAKEKRVAAQLGPDGSQPLELERTKSWDYSVMNLDGLIALAELGEAAGVDLWRYETADKRGIRRALEFLFQFKDGAAAWKYKQIAPLKFDKLYPLMRRAGRVYLDPSFTKMMRSVPSARPLDELTGNAAFSGVQVRLEVL
jgi:hypothetical protein